jgi:hypothetical protein
MCGRGRDSGEGRVARMVLRCGRGWGRGAKMDKEIGRKGVEDALVAVDAAKRETLRKLILGAAFVVPVVASFSIDGLTVSKAHATTTFSGTSGNVT